MLPPTFSSDAEYGARLADSGFWAPYVAEVLARHALPPAPLDVGSVGTFPTFLVGRYVVKLFGERFFGPSCFEVERSLQPLLASHPEILAPSPVAQGTLVGDVIPAAGIAPDGDTWPWPYLVMSRVAGMAWSDAALTLDEQAGLARQLGAVIRQLHDLPPPSGPAWSHDWLADHRATCVERQRRWKTLPARLVDQIDQYLASPSTKRILIHADLHNHHLFVQRGTDEVRLVGIIDWGDAFFADPYYELPALHFGTFDSNSHLLAAFLDGYGWRVDADFAHRAMTMALLHEFNVLDSLPQLVDLNAVTTLDELADLLWTPSCREDGTPTRCRR